MAQLPEHLRIALRGLAAALAICAGAAGADTVYWLAPRSNVTLDPQVAADIAPSARVVILRTSWAGPSDDYSTQAIVQRLKRAGTGPVLAYAWSNRTAPNGRGEVDLFKGMDIGKPVAIREESGAGPVSFLDISDPALRSRIARRYAEAKATLGVDGFAIDLSTRTPVRGVLHRRCLIDVGFCPDYAGAMDSLYAELRNKLGDTTMLAYNGLFNFAPGQLDDQAKLLANTDAVAIEYFGMDPNEKSHSFTHDIQPYLEAVARLPAQKQILFFGRGTWGYADYVADYAWQRYLYASFLQVARSKDLFKYHASFQVPAHAGRTGGLARFADWRIALGKPRGPGAAGAGGIWRREFAEGIVFVAPDDGNGGIATWSGLLYTPEGKALNERAPMAAGTGLILLRKPPVDLVRSDIVRIDAERIASWGWSGAKLVETQGRVKQLRVERANPRLIGEHDVLLDSERSLTPYMRLTVQAPTLAKDAPIFAVAEVDDTKKQADTVVFELSRTPAAGPRVGNEMPFRSSPPKTRPGEWQVLPVPTPSADGTFDLDGGRLLDGTRYRFRRWSHLRLPEGVDLQQIVLSRPRIALSMVRDRP